MLLLVNTLKNKVLGTGSLEGPVLRTFLFDECKESVDLDWVHEAECGQSQ